MKTNFLKVTGGLALAAVLFMSNISTASANEADLTVEDVNIEEVKAAADWYVIVGSSYGIVVKE